MTRLRPLSLLAVALLAAAGCRPGDGTPPADQLATEAGVPVPEVSMASPGIDTAPLAGRFMAPDRALDLGRDGSYRLRLYGTGPGDTFESEGIWALEPGSGQLLLVPHAADEPRLRYSMPADDELRPEDGGLALRREPLAAAR